MVGIIGILAAITLIIYLAYRGWGIIPASIVSSLVVILTNGGEIWQALSVNYINGLTYFAGTYFLLFVLGALFGQVMGESGSASAISYKLLNIFGPSKAIVVVTLATAILTYGGVNLFIVIFTIYPLALILFKEANLPKRLILASLGLGAATFTMTALPGTPAIQNLIPTEVLGTTATAAPVIGIVCSVFMLGTGLWYIESQAKKARNIGDGFVPGARDNMDQLTLADTDKLPDWKLALLPLIVVISLIFLLKGKMEALTGVSLALTVGIILTYLLHWKRFANPLKTLNEGAGNSIIPLINTAAIVGFGFVVQNVAGFQSFVQFALGLKLNPLVSAATAVNIIAGITGSSSGGLTIFMKTMGPAFMQMGIAPEALHRVASIASGGLDSLPHSGAVVTMLMIMGLTHKEAYKDLGVVTLVIPILATVIAVVLAIMLY